MMEVEIAVAQVQAQMGLIPKKAAADITKLSKFDEKKILNIEEKTKHDVIAFITNMAENVGPSGKYIHYGLTSSVVLDTAISLQIKKAAVVLMGSLKKMDKALRSLIVKHKTTLITGRTHGIHAEPTSFGLKLLGFYSELQRNKKRLNEAIDQVMICKLSGAVGAYTTNTQAMEKKVATKLKLHVEPVATQVVPRDRHAELLGALAMTGGFLERLSVELRHLQRTELGEVTESFAKGQKGSSAMPHKKNPISGENVTGLARLLRSYAGIGLENIALWHERDISHSSVERVIFPDAFILCDYALNRMAGVIANLQVNKERMLENMNISKGQVYSSQVLVAMVQKGINRTQAYELVQKVSHSLGKDDTLEEALKGNDEVLAILSKKEIGQIFSGADTKKRIKKLVESHLKRKW